MKMDGRTLPAFLGKARVIRVDPCSSVVSPAGTLRRRHLLRCLSSDEGGTYDVLIMLSRSLMPPGWLAAAVIGLLLLLVAATGCTPSPREGGFDSPDPAAKLYAIVRAGQQRDRSAVPRLIEQLDSDDMAVRMYAIQALERITGTRLGYRYYAPPAQRRQMVQRWVEAHREGRFTDSELVSDGGEAETGQMAHER